MGCATFGDLMRPKHLGPNASMASNVDLTGAFDPSTGMPYQTKKIRWPEIFELRFDPEKIMMSPPLAVGVETVFKEVFPDETRGDKPVLKIALHPWFKRWCLWEHVPAEETDAGRFPEGWAFVQMFYKRGSIKPGYLPDDLNYEDKRCEDLRGQIGDYAPPDREWLEWTKGHCSFEKMPVEKMLEFLISEQVDNKRETESEHESMLHDFHSYYWNMFRDLANVEEGSASKSMQCNQTSLEELDRRKWEQERSHIVEFEGVKHRVKRGSRHEQWLFDKIAAKNNEKEEKQKKLIEHSYTVEKDLDRRNMLRKAKRLSLGMSDTKTGHNGRTM